MSEYPGQEFSIEQLFHAVNAKILERAQLSRSSVPETDQERWVSISVANLWWVDDDGRALSFQISDIHKQLCETSANVRFLENSLHPFHGLHPDTILEISKYLDPRACDNSYTPLLRASQICRSWRDTLVFRPSLWSFIDGSHPDLIPYLLGRSKNAHLDVYIVSYWVEEVIAYINPHIDRLRSIHIELGLNGDSQFVALRGLSAAPMLRRLNIECRGILDPDHLRFTPGIIEPIPSLCHLQLFGIHLTPQLIQLRNLTFVSLDASRAPLKDYLDLLSGNPLLKAIHLWGKHVGHVNEDNSHPPGSINLPHLEVLSSEMIPLVHLEALSPPRGARIFSGFAHRDNPNYHPIGPYTTSFSIPPSFSNLQNLRKLRFVDQKEIYVELGGEGGSITYCVYRDCPFTTGTFSDIQLEGITDATYEHRSPAGLATSRPIVSRIICGMTRLQRLELSRCNAEQLGYFLLVLHSINVCRDLKFLVLSHCVGVHQQMRDLVTMSEGRNAAGMGLDTVRIIDSNTEFLNLVFSRRLERAVGTLEYLQTERGRTGWASMKSDPDIGVSQPHMFF